MRRPAVLAIVMVMVNVILVAGCAALPVTPEATAQEKIRTALIRQIETLPGATITARIQSGLDTGQNNIGVQARLPAAATGAQLNALGDSIERIIWLSHLDPLGSIGITFTRVGSKDRVLQRLYQDEIDTRPLGVKYGPRPDGLPG